MSRPLFEVGEVVIAVFKSYPQNNGEYVVSEILDAESAQREASGFGMTRQRYYRLDGLKVVGNINPNHTTDLAGESALRKKHEPGEQSFRDLMQSLKQGQPA